MGGIISIDELSIDALKAMRDMVANALLDMVSKKANKSRSELIVRDILPLTDLGFNTEEWSNQTAQSSGAWTKDWSHELDEDQGAAFYGVAIQDETCDLIFVRFKLGATGATTKAIYSLQRLIKEGQEESDKKQTGFFPEPVYYGGKETPYVDYYARGSVSQYAAHVVLIGLFCEPKGENVS